MSIPIFIIIILGLITVIQSVLIGVSFFKQGSKLKGDSKRLSRALFWQLLGEGTIGLGTLNFAIGAHFGWLDDWSYELQSLIRFIMFFSTAATTLHLWFTMRSIAR